MFEMTLDVAIEFYRRCEETNAQTRQARTNILLDMASEGKIASVMETQRTPDEIAADMAKNFGDVLYIRPKEEQ